MRRSRAVWGAAAVLAYLAAALVSWSTGLVPGRVIFDGVVPLPPYRWVDPPPDLAEDNLPPSGATTTVELEAEGSPGRTVGTQDGQAFVILPLGAVEPVSGEESFTVSITPTTPPAPVQGNLTVDGNAYRVEMTYTVSGGPVSPVRDFTVVLRYPVHAEEMLRWQGDDWVVVEGTQLAPQSQQMFARVREPGTYAAAGPPSAPEMPLWVLLVAGSALAVALGYLVERVRARRRAVTDAARAKRGGGSS